MKVSVPSLTASGDVKVGIYSLSYRKVQDVTFPNVQPGESITLKLLDKAGVHLADGIYYLVVTPPNGHKNVLKLLVLR